MSSPPATSDVVLGLIRGATAREIGESIESAVESGKLTAGQVIPSVRALAAHLGVSPMTVSVAFRDLRMRGIVTTHERRRTRITSSPPIARRVRPALDAHIHDLASDNPDPAFLPDISAVIDRVDLGPRTYVQHTLLPELDAIARADFESIHVAPAAIACFGGTFEVIERALTLHARPGDAVAVEDPGYSGVLDLVRAIGLSPVGVQVDEDGIRPDALESALRDGAVAMVVTPRAQNPMGAAFDERRAKALRRVLARFPDVLVVEDDHGGPITEEPYFTLTAGRNSWIVVRSVSKSLGPDLRLSLVGGDRGTIHRLEGRRALAGGWVSHTLQSIVVELRNDRAVGRLLRNAAAAYGERRRALISELSRRGIAAVGRSGLNVWVPVSE
jgi:DNA-binding transcriptional MocR family regulator